MTAPDKIYMPNELLSEDWTRHIEGEDTAYIRQDVTTLFKPTKEQMDALLWVIENSYKSEDVNISLNSLYEQLKAL